MLSVFVPARFKPQTKPLAFAASQLITQHWGLSTKTDWLAIKIMCTSVATYLRADYCFTVKIQLIALVWYKADIVIISLNVTCS